MEMMKTIALVGSPGCRLSSLFNQLTGGRTKNAAASLPAGQTKAALAKGFQNLTLIQLPEVFSLSADSMDDTSVRDVLLWKKPDLVIQAVDPSSLSLYLTLQLLELDTPLVLALDTSGEWEKNAQSLYAQYLSSQLGILVFPVSFQHRQPLRAFLCQALEAAAQAAIDQKRHTRKAAGQMPRHQKKEDPQAQIYSGPLYTARCAIDRLIQEKAFRASLAPAFCVSMLLEQDQEIQQALALESKELELIRHQAEDAAGRMGTDCQTAMAQARYDFIEQLRQAAPCRPSEDGQAPSFSVRLDQLLTHRLLALPIFLAVMLLVFYGTFGPVGTLLSQWLSLAIDQVTEFISYALLAAGVNPAFHSLVVDGVCAGVGSVLSFVPVIAVLFFFLSILEECGYMPRAAFVMDRLLGGLGLSGRCLVPMLIGFGCSVPAIMAARSLPGKHEQRLTMLLIPFMSCSAKLPIYTLLTAAFFTKGKVLIMAVLYFTGILVAIFWALVFKKTFFRDSNAPLAMVLPPYRLPSAKNVVLAMWENAKGFIKKAFTVIFTASILIWFLQNFDTSFQMTAHSDDSILAAIGKYASPVFAPLGFGDWRAVTALLAGISAKEAIVSTLAVLTQSGGTGSLPMLLTQMFTPLSACSFLVFCLLYTPCVAALGTIRKEMGGWPSVLRVVLLQCSTAWVVSFLTFQIGGLLL
ncbi:ferrous iron transport protein B [Clostridiales bacterium]|nr:ferrous iron transport protein B [Clostridiales bacterium]